MQNETVALIVSFFAVVFVVIAYFCKNKSAYLLFQALSILCLAVSYFFSLEFFAMIGLSVSLCRTVVFFFYEKKGKEVPIIGSYIFSGVTVLAYFLVNWVILKTAKPIDIICVLSLIGYCFIFRIRNLQTVRYAMTVPLSLSIIYNIFCNATIFAVASYSVELVADLFSIIKNRKRKEIVSQDK